MCILFFCLEHTTGPKHIFKNDQSTKNNNTQLLHCTSRFPMLSVLPTRRLQTAKNNRGHSYTRWLYKIPLKSRKLTEAEELHQKLCSPCRKQVFPFSFSLHVFTSRAVAQCKHGLCSQEPVQAESDLQQSNSLPHFKIQYTEETLLHGSFWHPLQTDKTVLEIDSQTSEWERWSWHYHRASIQKFSLRL